jgi:hypothetical protein
MCAYDIFRDLQLVFLAVFNDLKENPIATIVQEVDGVGDGLLYVIPIHKEVAKAVEGVSLDTLEGLAVYCAELLEYRLRRRNGVTGISHCGQRRGGKAMWMWVYTGTKG